MQLVAEVDFTTLFMDVDKKMKTKSGITLSISEFTKLKQATNYIDEKIRRQMKEKTTANK